METNTDRDPSFDLKKCGGDTDGRIKESHMVAAKMKLDKIILSLDIEAREVERKIEMKRIAEERKFRAEQLQRKKMEKDAQQKALCSLITATRRRSRCESEIEAMKAQFNSRRCDVKRECVITCKVAETGAKQVLAELLQTIECERKDVKKALNQIRDESKKQRLEDTLKQAEKEYKQRVKNVAAVLQRKRDMAKREREIKLLYLDAEEKDYRKKLQKELYEIGKVIKKGRTWEIGQKVNVEIPAFLEKLEMERSEALAKIEEQRKAATEWYQEKQRKYQQQIKKEREEAKRKVEQQLMKKEKRELDKLLAQKKKGKELQEVLKKREEKVQAVKQKQEEEWQAEVKRREQKRDAAHKRICKERLEYDLMCEKRSLRFIDEAQGLYGTQKTKEEEQEESEQIGKMWKRMKRLALLGSGMSFKEAASRGREAADG